MRQAHILATRGPRSWATDSKNFQMAITHSIFAQIIFPFAQTFLSIKNCLLQKKTKIQENLFLRLEFTKLSGPMAVMKNLKKKNFSCENKKCLYVINKHFLFPKLIAKMSWWFSIKQNAKKTRFLPFLHTRWGWNHSKTPFSDSQRQITPILTPQPKLYSFRDVT